MKAQTVIFLFGVICIAAVYSQTTAKPSFNLCGLVNDVATNKITIPTFPPSSAKTLFEALKKLNGDCDAKNKAKIIDDLKAAMAVPSTVFKDEKAPPIVKEQVASINKVITDGAIKLTDQQMNLICDVVACEKP
jgi:hypothetical protein